jgi:glycosyltransferase involved in cell wall biosynthesis
LLADPGLDLSRDEECRLHVERVVHGLREVGHEVSFVAVQSNEVVLTDTGFGLQQFFEAARGVAETADEAAPHLPSPVSGELLRFARQNRVPVSALTTSNLAFCAGRRLFRGCDLIHTLLSPLDVGGLLCARVLEIPLVVEVNAPPRVEGKPVAAERSHQQSQGMARISASRTLGDADAIVTVSTALRELLVSDWAVKPEIVTVLRHAADAPPPTSPERLAQLRRQYELGERPVVIFIGARESWHGLDVLLEALVAVRALYPELTLLVVGDGPLRQRMEERAASLDLSASVRFIGGVAPEPLGQLLAVADVAVAPSPPRPFEFHSPEIAEYMAAGKAIVASRLGSVAEILTDGETALLVEPGSRDELAQAIGRLLEAGDLRRRLGDNARHDAEREHTWTGYARRLATIYESVLSSAQ